MTLEQERWEMWQGVAWIAAVKIRITNTTTGQVVRLERFNLDSDPGIGERPKLTQDQVNHLFHEVRRQGDTYGSSHLRRVDLQPGDSTSGWWVREAYLPYPARAGRPRCTFAVTDGVGDTYQLVIPARPPQVRRIEP